MESQECSTAEGNAARAAILSKPARLTIAVVKVAENEEPRIKLPLCVKHRFPFKLRLVRNQKYFSGVPYA